MKRLGVAVLACDTIRKRSVAAVLSIVSAVALPQLMHLVGRLCGAGSSLGEMFLPMHFSVLLAGLLAGAWTGAAVGALSPVLSFLLTGMPSAEMLPFMTIEIAVYGALTGALAERKLPDLAKLFVAQIGGRVCKAAAMAFAFYCLQSPIGMDMLLSSLLLGIPGILLQWVIIPPLFSFAKDASENG